MYIELNLRMKKRELLGANYNRIASELNGKTKAQPIEFFFWQWIHENLVSSSRFLFQHMRLFTHFTETVPKSGFLDVLSYVSLI